MKLFDTHCHFDRADPTEIAAILERAKAAGVEKLMAVGGSPKLNESAALAVEVAEEALVAPQVVCAVGLDREQVKDLRRETKDLGGRETKDARRGLSSNVSGPPPCLSSSVFRPRSSRGFPTCSLS